MSRSGRREMRGGLCGPRFGRARVPRPAQPLPLPPVRPGREVEIAALREMAGPRISRLGAFGVVPGSRIEVVQRRPAPGGRVGETASARGPRALARDAD